MTQLAHGWKATREKLAEIGAQAGRAKMRASTVLNDLDVLEKARAEPRDVRQR